MIQPHVREKHAVNIAGMRAGVLFPFASGMARPLIFVAPGRGKGVPGRPRSLSTPMITRRCATGLASLSKFLSTRRRLSPRG